MIDTASPPRPSAFAFLPVGLFGSVMGLTGLSVAWRLAQARYAAPVWIAEAIGVLALIAFVALVIAYATEAVTAPVAVVAQFPHPIAGNLFGAFFIRLLLIPILIAPYARLLAIAPIMDIRLPTTALDVRPVRPPRSSLSTGRTLRPRRSDTSSQRLRGDQELIGRHGGLVK